MRHSRKKTESVTRDFLSLEVADAFWSMSTALYWQIQINLPSEFWPRSHINEENFLGCWMRDNMQDKIPGIHVGGEATALLALILWANFISSSDEIFLLLAWLMAVNFCLAWYIAVDCKITNSNVKQYLTFIEQGMFKFVKEVGGILSFQVLNQWQDLIPL